MKLLTTIVVVASCLSPAVVRLSHAQEQPPVLSETAKQALIAQDLANLETSKSSPAAAVALADVGHVQTPEELLRLVQAGQASKCVMVTNPAGADIYIDGNKATLTPFAFVLLRKGDTPRVITIKMSGYKTVEKKVLPDGKPVFLNLILEKESQFAQQPTESQQPPAREQPRGSQQPPAKEQPTESQQPPAKDMTLREFRAMYLNQRILILKGQNSNSSLDDLQPMKRDKKGNFVDDYGGELDFRYKEQTPTVIAIREAAVSEHAKEGTVNALGEKVTDDDIANPYVDVIVQFDDKKIACYRNFVSHIMDRYGWDMEQLDTDQWNKPLMLVPLRDAHSEVITANLSSVIGKQIYAVHDSLLFGPDLTPEVLLDSLKRWQNRKQDVALLTPVTIIAAHYNKRFDFIVWKLRLADGREIISASRYRDEDVSTNGNDNSFFGRSIGTLLQRMPPNLTDREISAISARKVFRGMSRQAVLYSWGRGKENDYGKGGKQLVYGDNQFVYLDDTGHVTDWHSLNE